jgi:succinate dehydrogenase flavin-adding protein (antitoxin of CptAB toxin-antitoxin module)
MPVTLSDMQIDLLLNERKQLPDDYRSRIQMKPRRGHRERELSVTGFAKSEFVLILRESNFNPLDFSIILGCQPAGYHTLFRLCRYNGKSHEHTNKIEGQTFYDFHRHTATERYQASGFREDGFAEPTDRFQDFAGALRCMFEDCAFSLPIGEHPELGL